MLKIKNELEYIEVSNELSSIKIALQGAHIFDFRVKEKAPLLFLSETSHFKVGKAIRGGIPICWPWFGEHPSDSSLQNHGFARTSMWTHISTEEIDKNSTKIILELKSSEETEKLWSYQFELQLEIIMSDRLELSLITKNKGSKPFVITQALHTYLLIQNISTTCVEGLDQTMYYDKLTNTYNNPQKGKLCFNSEVDRVYEKVAKPLRIKEIEVQTVGSNTVVVWNPGKNFKNNFSDLSDYRTMLCIESANTLNEEVTIEAKSSYILKTILFQNK
jgi:glucose-6-phosphate 1-epimerase